LIIEFVLLGVGLKASYWTVLMEANGRLKAALGFGLWPLVFDLGLGSLISPVPCTKIEDQRPKTKATKV